MPDNRTYLSEVPYPYGIISKPNGLSYVIEGTFLSEALRNDLRGTLASIKVIKNEEGTYRQFENYPDALSWCMEQAKRKQNENK